MITRVIPVIRRPPAPNSAPKTARAIWDRAAEQRIDKTKDRCSSGRKGDSGQNRLSVVRETRNAPGENAARIAR